MKKLAKNHSALFASKIRFKQGFEAEKMVAERNLEDYLLSLMSAAREKMEDSNQVNNFYKTLFSLIGLLYLYNYIYLIIFTKKSYLVDIFNVRAKAQAKLSRASPRGIAG